MMVLSHLQKTLASLSRAERRIGEVILADPHTIVHATTAELARRAHVSDPMISRLCKSLGYKSFPEFKVQLAKSLVTSGGSYLTQAVAAEDEMPVVINKLIDANMAALEYMRGQIDHVTVVKVIEHLNQAKNIVLFGMGGCASIAQDAQHRFFRLGTPCIAYEDTLKQRMAAAAANSDTAILFLSFTGRTKAVIETAKIARASGATVIAITDPTSPLAQVCELVITSSSELEDTTVYVPMATRMSILTVIDILATGLSQARGPAIQKHLQQIKRSLESTKVGLSDQHSQSALEE